MCFGFTLYLGTQFGERLLHEPSPLVGATVEVVGVLLQLVDVDDGFFFCHGDLLFVEHSFLHLSVDERLTECLPVGFPLLVKVVEDAVGG